MNDLEPSEQLLDELIAAARDEPLADAEQVAILQRRLVAVGAATAGVGVAVASKSVAPSVASAFAFTGTKVMVAAVIVATGVTATIGITTVELGETTVESGSEARGPRAARRDVSSATAAGNARRGSEEPGGAEGKGVLEDPEALNGIDPLEQASGTTNPASGTVDREAGAAGIRGPAHGAVHPGQPRSPRGIDPPPNARSESHGLRAGEPEASSVPPPSARLGVGLLRQAQELLASDPMAAMAALDRHGRQFGGAMAEEREILYIDALERAGNVAAAAARRRAFAARFPNSAYRNGAPDGVASASRGPGGLREGL